MLVRVSCPPSPPSSPGHQLIKPRSKTGHQLIKYQMVALAGGYSNQSNTKTYHSKQIN